MNMKRGILRVLRSQNGGPGDGGLGLVFQRFWRENSILNNGWLLWVLSGGLFGVLGGSLGPSLGSLGSSWAASGASWGALGLPLGVLGLPLGAPGTLLGCFLGSLGCFWSYFDGFWWFFKVLPGKNAIPVQNNKKNITFTYITAIPGVCYAGKNASFQKKH